MSEKREFDNSMDWYDWKYGQAGWHDADECDDENCKLAHRHDTNCRCPDCYMSDQD